MEVDSQEVKLALQQKGAEYVSGFDKAIIKLAKLNGFKLKKLYIESLLKKIILN